MVIVRFKYNLGNIIWEWKRDTFFMANFYRFLLNIFNNTITITFDYYLYIINKF